MLDQGFEALRVRPNEDLQHAKRWVVVAGALLVPDAPPRIHDHEVVGIDRKVAALGVIVAHHAGRDPGDDLVHDMLVELDVGARGQEGFHDRGEGPETVVGVSRLQVTGEIGPGREAAAVDGILRHSCRLADHGGIDFLACRADDAGQRAGLAGVPFRFDAFAYARLGLYVWRIDAMGIGGCAVLNWGWQVSTLVGPPTAETLARAASLP